ncbi:hypothetical protein PUV54_13025 [Hyphococcus flavus]|uniref:Peptidase S8/S53 domain-containing protein n=1 Tax=Hyphococcus flavus TaxID=1866326 RepID=A0AAE9ZDD8_9PROT|nr:hypothetical protein [Hyphococcus flavus]WDI30877.1 hypothetical protein PUV54_13025 [Hyphococcus flavus]
MLKKLLLSAGFAAAICAAPSLASAKGGESDAYMKKMEGALTIIYDNNRSALAARNATRTAPAARNRPDWSGEGGALGRVQAGGQELMVADVSDDGYVVLDAIAAGSTDDLSATMDAMGARNISSLGRTVSAQFPVDRLGDLAASNYLAFARPALAATNVGLVTSQGDRSMRTDFVREELGYDGENMTIGILSDSFACNPGPLNAAGVYTTPAEDAANGDIPPDVGILSDYLQSDCIDEGRGMAQLIHDVAPGAKLLFHSAFNGEADFAEGIVELALAGADVIVDDIIYFTEPMFQDGIIAQAADEVARLGVPYYSSNGNRARDAYQSEYRPVAFDNSTFHDFDPGPGVEPLMTVQLNGALQTNLTFQWDSPNFSVSGAPGAQNDVDVIMFDMQGNRVFDCFEPGGQSQPNGLCQFKFTSGGIPLDGGNGGDAIELVSLVDFIGGQQVQIGFETQSGDAPGFTKFVIFGGGIVASEFPINAPSGFGHNNAAGSEGVGASAFYFTEEFIGDPSTLQLRSMAGEPECVPACLNDFSSAGGTPIFFDTDGNRLSRPEVRYKPGITGPDGTNTTFFTNDTSRDDDDGDGVFQTGEPGEFPNFFGTSASAPHVASVAALMLQSEKSQIVRTSSNGQVSYRMCKPRQINPRGRGLFRKKHPQTERIRGRDMRVSPDEVLELVEEGVLLGPCDRTEPEDVYWIKRLTAQDMSVRASNATGATIQVFDEVNRHGFDFDSGFGFIDAKKALEKFDRGRGARIHGKKDHGKKDDLWAASQE